MKTMFFEKELEFDNCRHTYLILAVVGCWLLAVGKITKLINWEFSNFLFIFEQFHPDGTLQAFTFVAIFIFEL